MTTPGSTLLDINVGELTLIGGRRQSDVTHMAVLSAPRRVHADRRQETLFVFLDLGGGGASGLARTMLEHLNQTYWQHPGAVTSALRQAIATANAHLLEENRLLTISQRRRGGLVCIVLRDNHFYLAQIGPARALLVQDGQVTPFPEGPREELPLGVSRGLDIFFTHSYLNAGDVLLLTGESWSAGLPEGVLLATLSDQEGNAQDIMRALERQAGVAPVSALIVECALPGASPAPRPSAASVRHPTGEWVETQPDAVTLHAPSATELESGGLAAVEVRPQRDSQDTGAGTQPRPGGRLSNPLAALSIDAERLDQVRQGLRRAGETLGDGARTLLTRVLPEPEPASPRRRRASEAGAENTPMMAGIAIAIALVVAFIVVTFYLQRNTIARQEALMDQAREAIQAARQADGQQAREHWNTALQAAQEALLVTRDDELVAWRDEAQGTLDALDGVLRPELMALGDYGSGQGFRLAATRLQVYVLDTEQDQVTQHMLSADNQYALVAYRGFNVGDAQISELRDVVWLEAGGAWVNDALLILTADNQLLQYSLSWGLSWVPFDTGLAHVNAHALRPFDGRLYVLDPEQSQIWRFPLGGDGFGPPEGYFAAAAPDLSSAIDLAIDGAVYILLADGRIYKFFSAEAQPYQPSGLPQPLTRPVALVSEGDVTSGALYVADAGSGSIIALSKSGQFIHQIKADGDALAGLQALAIEESSRTLYALANGHLYALALPPLPAPPSNEE